MEFALENGLKLKLNNDYTASIISSSKVTGNVFIPRFVEYQGTKYIITTICSYSFSNTKIDSLTFASDSEITSIEKNSFDCAHIKKLQIPPNLKYMDLLSLSCIYDLVEIEVSPKNRLFSYINSRYLVGKINEKSKKYDILYFARTDIKEAKILSTIKVLNSYSFFNHKQLQSIIFPANSELKKIDNNVFPFTTIQKLVLPETVEEIDSSNFCGISNLTEIEVSPKNKFFSCIDKKYLAKKSDKKNGFFDVIVFVRRDIVEFKVPSHIKVIEANAFQSCSHLKTIIFDSNSQLEVIEKEAFSNICGQQCLSIPASVKKIGDQAFSNIKDLRFVEVLGRFVEINFSPFCSCKNLAVISFPNAARISMNCNYCMDQLPSETEIHVRNDVKLIGRGSEEFLKQMEVVRHDSYLHKVFKMKTKKDQFEEDQSNSFCSSKQSESFTNDDFKFKDKSQTAVVNNMNDDSKIEGKSKTIFVNDENSFENNGIQILINYIRSIENRLSRYEVVEPFDFESFKEEHQKKDQKVNRNQLCQTNRIQKQANNQLCGFTCSICNRPIENDIIIISGDSYHKKCVTFQMNQKAISTENKLTDFVPSEVNSLLLLKNYNNLSPTKLLSSIKPQSNISESKKSLINLIDSELIKNPYEIKVADVKLINNKFNSIFEQNKLKASLNFSIEERFLFNGTSIQNEAKIKEEGFSIPNGEEKFINANKNLFYASLNANENKPLKKGQTVSVLFCKSFYNKDKMIEFQDFDEQTSSEIKENFGIYFDYDEVSDSKSFIFLKENQIIPVFSLTVKLPDYFILWKVSRVDEEIKNYKKTFLSILHVNFYCFTSFDKALEMIKLKRKNPIRLVTNSGDNLAGTKLIREARKIVGSNFLCLIFDKKGKDFDRMPELENVLLTTSPQYFGKFAALPMDVNKQLNYIDDLKNHQNSNYSYNINKNEMMKFPLVDE